MYTVYEHFGVISKSVALAVWSSGSISACHRGNWGYGSWHRISLKISFKRMQNHLFVIKVNETANVFLVRTPSLTDKICFVLFLLFCKEQNTSMQNLMSVAPHDSMFQYTYLFKLHFTGLLTISLDLTAKFVPTHGTAFIAAHVKTDIGD
jgi:hypothetical protein